MRALLFDPSWSRLPLAGVASRLRPELALRGRAPLGLREMAEASRPGGEWVRLRVLRTGICGSDVKEALLQASSDNPLSALVSFPHVPGHEILGEVADGNGGAEMPLGTLVAVDPWLGCLARGAVNLCPACRRGFPPHCDMVLDGGPWGTGRGMHLGTVRGLPGGFSQFIHAHRSQLHLLPAGLSPPLAVLADPVAVALHAVEHVADPPAGPVLVLGAGTIGLSLALAARERWPRADIYATVAWDNQVALMEQLGATALRADPSAVMAEMSRDGRSRLAKPWRGGPWTLGGGVDLALDSIGSSATTELALRSLAPGGRLVTVGVGRPERTETTLTYYKEARIQGSNGYGISSARPGHPHLLDSALQLLAQRTDQVSGWLTHCFPLSQWQEAFTTAARPDRSHSIKVSLQLWEDWNP